MRWRRSDEARLRRMVCGFAEWAAELGITEAAIRRKRSRLLQKVRADRRCWSLARLARHAGYHHSVIERVAQRLGQEWRSNARSGTAARYWLTPRQVQEVLHDLMRATRWSRFAASCRRCRKAESPHRARGLCRRCYKAERRRQGG